VLRRSVMNDGGTRPHLTFHPLTSALWRDFETLFGPRGAAGGCWCMWWRLTAKEFGSQKGEKNRHAMKALVDKERVPGILAFVDSTPVGWCSVAPREEFPRLQRSRVAVPIDDQPVWSVVCFFVAKSHRRSGVAIGLLKAAVDYVRERGGTMLEGYPVEPRAGCAPDVFAYQGTATLFRRAGFREVIRRSPTRPIMRFAISDEIINAGGAEVPTGLKLTSGEGRQRREGAP